MKIAVLAFLLLLPLSPAQADEDQVPPAGEGKTVQSPVPRTTPPAQPQPFAPSQQIGADSHISFPTDI